MIELTVAEYKFFLGFKVYSLFRYEGVVRKILHSMKYGGFKSIAERVSLYMAHLVEKEDFNLVVPVPIHPARKRERGFSQTDILAHSIARILKKPVGRPVFRHSYRKPQAKLGRLEQRFRNIAGAFGCLWPVKNAKVLLVDDVITTGATFVEVAGTLRENGAVNVVGLTVARA